MNKKQTNKTTAIPTEQPAEKITLTALADMCNKQRASLEVCKLTLEEAANEIRALRSINDRNALRLKMFDDLMQLAKVRPQYDDADKVTRDILYKIDEIFIEEISEDFLPS